MRPIYRMFRRRRDDNWRSSPTPAAALRNSSKQEHFRQIFVSRTKPGVTRGNHYHHTKTEKFLVVEGDGLIRMRAVEGGPVEEYSVTGSAIPGDRHSARIHPLDHNVGAGEMVTLFWSSEISIRIARIPTIFRSTRGANHAATGERMKVATILGTRPEIIRLSRVIAALDRYTEHVLIHTGPELRLRTEPGVFRRSGDPQSRLLSAGGGQECRRDHCGW